MKNITAIEFFNQHIKHLTKVTSNRRLSNKLLADFTEIKEQIKLYLIVAPPNKKAIKVKPSVVKKDKITAIYSHFKLAQSS